MEWHAELDSAAAQLTYPEDLKLFGLSFNTTYGNYSFQGEFAYRPDLPLQVSLADLAFAAMGPTLGHCNDPEDGCFGTAAALGFDENSTGTPVGNGQNPTGGFTIYDGSDAVDANGEVIFDDTSFLLIAGVPNSARSFPNFIIPYRGGSLGAQGSAAFMFTHRGIVVIKAAGATEDVAISYGFTDDSGAAGSGTLTVTVSGSNDAPTAPQGSALRFDGETPRRPRRRHLRPWTIHRLRKTRNRCSLTEREY